MSYSSYVCLEVSSYCPVSISVYGYAPNLGVNVFFAAFFGLCLIIQVAQGIKYKSKSFTIPFALGCLAECIGYVGRILLHKNVWDNVGFEMQICCLIMAPAFLAAAIYLTLMHIVNTLGPQYSPITPKFYPWIFISCDFLSLVLQAAGGGTAATAKGNKTLADAGGNVMLAGIVWQVFTLMVFGGLCAEYFRRVYVNRYNLTPSATAVFNSTKFRLFVAAVTIAFTTIFIRCAFRIAELADGWKSPIMQNEVEFIVFDGVMCLIAVIVLTIFSQGQYFPQMQEHNSVGRPALDRHSSDLSGSDVEAAGEKQVVSNK
ncbi:hypothetical protein MMC26_003449 [Xylographa opegraphella]|nr:hypothetical protein [Xylographa opegraphella]